MKNVGGEVIQMNKMLWIFVNALKYFRVYLKLCLCVCEAFHCSKN